MKAIVKHAYGSSDVLPLGRYLRALLLSPFVSQTLRVHAAKPRHQDLAALRDGGRSKPWLSHASSRWLVRLEPRIAVRPRS